MVAELQPIIVLAAIVVLLLTAIAFYAYRVLEICVQVLILLRAGWRRRTAINPFRPSGRWTLLGCFFLAIAFLFIVPMFQRDLREPFLRAVGIDALFAGIMAFTASGIVSAVLAMRCFAHAKRFSARLATEVLADDLRPPVLYLRSFSQDFEAARRVSFVSGQITTEEGDIADIVRSVGPLIAIGRPDEELSYFGAARLYVNEGDWQQCVLELIEQAPLVILRAGKTFSLMWEIETCVQRLCPERLAILVPFGRRRYEQFRMKTQRLFPSSLPDYNGRRFPETTIRGIIVFDANWSPHMWPVMPEGYLVHWIRRFHRSFFANDVLTRQESDMHRAPREILEPAVQRLAAATQAGCAASSS